MLRLLFSASTFPPGLSTSQGYILRPFSTLTWYGKLALFKINPLKVIINNKPGKHKLREANSIALSKYTPMLLADVFQMTSTRLDKFLEVRALNIANILLLVDNATLTLRICMYEA